GPQSVAHWGTYVTTPKASRSSATVEVKTELVNRLAEPSTLTVRSSIVDGNGQTVAHVDTQSRLPGSGNQTLATRLTLQHTRLWDIDDPYLYSLTTELISNGEVVDRYVTPFGVRTITFDPNKS